MAPASSSRTCSKEDVRDPCALFVLLPRSVPVIKISLNKGRKTRFTYVLSYGDSSYYINLVDVYIIVTFQVLETGIYL